MRVVVPLVAAALIAVGVFIWSHARDYQKYRLLERFGFPQTQLSPAAPPVFTPALEDVEMLCRHMQKLGASQGNCSVHFLNMGQLDGEQLWALRHSCMLEAQELDVAYRCNRAHHSNWPEPNGSPGTFALAAPTAQPQTLCEAAAQGDLEVVRRLSSEGQQETCTLDDGTYPEPAQLTPLMLASLFGHFEVVEFFLEHGIEPGERDTQGRTALIHAASGNHIAIVDLYWRRGSRPNAADPHIGTLLWSAGTWNRKEVLEHYVQQGADLDAEHFGHTALSGAVQSDHLALVRWLLAHGARVRPQDVQRAKDLGLVADLRAASRPSSSSGSLTNR